MKMKCNKKYIVMNMLNNSVHLIVASNYWKALDKGKKWFGDKSKIRVVEDTLSTS